MKDVNYEHQANVMIIDIVYSNQELPSNKQSTSFNCPNLLADKLSSQPMVYVIDTCPILQLLTEIENSVVLAMQYFIKIIKIGNQRNGVNRVLTS